MMVIGELGLSGAYFHMQRIFLSADLAGIADAGTSGELSVNLS
jgi:hypothetical protein